MVRSPRGGDGDFSLSAGRITLNTGAKFMCALDIILVGVCTGMGFASFHVGGCQLADCDPCSRSALRSGTGPPRPAPRYARSTPRPAPGWRRRGQGRGIYRARELCGAGYCVGQDLCHTPCELEGCVVRPWPCRAVSSAHLSLGMRQEIFLHSVWPARFCVVPPFVVKGM